MRRGGGLVALAMLLILGLSAAPARGGEPDLRKVKRVAILNLRNFAGLPGALFKPGEEDPLEARAALLLSDLGDRLGTEGLVVVYQGDELRKRVTNSKEYDEEVA